MNIQSEKLIEDLIERTKVNLNQAEKLHQKTIEELNWKSEPNSWSVLECIEHLNLYGDFYLSEIEQRISESNFSTETTFKSGILGNYFAKMMLPREKLNKMKTFKDKDPIGSNLTKISIERFINQQQKTLELLNTSRKISLNKTKTTISISKCIKLKLGDTFRVVIYHNERHIAQALGVLKQMSNE